MYKLNWNSVSDITTEGGTILHTARCPEFKEAKHRKKAIENIRDKHISALIVIGGDGSMNGARALAGDIEQEGGTLITVAIPGTIDNDLLTTDMSLGAASAANAMIEQLRNMIRPAQALRRIFVVEVMGALSGFLALQSAIGIGADAVLIPESVVEIGPQWDSSQGTWKEHVNVSATEANLKGAVGRIAEQLRAAFIAGKHYGFVILAEGINLSTKGVVEKVYGDEASSKYLDANYVKELLQSEIGAWDVSDPPEVRTQILGYPVRGVRPCRFDVWLGAVLGQAAVECLIDARETNVMVGWEEGRGIVTNSYAEVIDLSNQPPKDVWANRTKWHSLLALQSSLTSPPKLLNE
jgi:6-phosphofructokinase